MAHETVNKRKRITITIPQAEMQHAPAVLQGMGMPAALANVFLAPETQAMRELQFQEQQKFLMHSGHEERVLQLQNQQAQLQLALKQEERREADV